MAVTRLKRKDRRNKARAHNRIKKIKQLTLRPVIKKVEDTSEAKAASKAKTASKAKAASDAKAAEASQEEE